MRWIFWVGAVGLILQEAAVAQGVPSNIVPDDSLGGERSQVIPFNPQIDLIQGGAARGINLFQSFREFNIGDGRTVYFISPGLEIQNILARVTGNRPSEILGKLGTAGLDNGDLAASNASLFLINPNGIVFGPKSSLDVDRSFTATTASAIEFGNQGNFSATNPGNGLPLLTINPSAYLFSQVPVGDIVNRSRAGDAAQGLQVPNGKTLTLLGGNVTIDGGRLSALGGRVEIGAVAVAGRVEIGTSENLGISTGMQRADVVFTKQAYADVALDNAGNIRVVARNIDLLGGSILYAGILPGFGTPASQAGDITLNATEAITITQSQIRNWVFLGATGNGGNIFINTDSLSFTGGGFISASTFGSGNAGSVSIQAIGDVRLDTRSTIFSLAESQAEGNAGNINISARNLFITKSGLLSASTLGRGNAGDVILNVDGSIVLDGTDPRSNIPSAIFSSVFDNAIGQGGNIRITTGSLSITNSAKLDTSVFGRGDGGDIIINAQDSVTLDGFTRGFDYGSAIFSTIEETGRGSAGDIRIVTGSLSVLNGGTIQSLTKNQGNAGNIFIDAQGSVIVDGASIQNLDNRGTEGLFISVVSSEISSEVYKDARGNAGSIIINAGRNILLNQNAKIVPGVLANTGKPATDINPSRLANNVSIRSRTSGQGNAGDIILNAGSQVLMNNDAGISASTNGFGKSGNVRVQALEKVILDNDSVIENLVDEKGVGNGGSISLYTGTLLIKNAAQIDSSTFGQGRAGNVIIYAYDSVIFTGEKRQERGQFTNIFSSGILSTTERGNTYADAGNIDITTGILSIADGAELRTITARQGNAGRISVNARDQINLTQNAEINSSTSGQGNAGDINLQSNRQINLDGNARVVSRVEQGALGNGGTILIDTVDLSATNVGTLEATTNGRGNAGNVIIQARNSVKFSESVIRENQREITSSGISTSVGQFGIGKAGNIRIDSASLFMQESGINAFTRGEGDSGNIDINSSDSVFLDKSTIASIVGYPLSPGQFGKGDGGTIRINTNSLVLTNGGQLQASTFGQGNAGNIIINARKSADFSGFRDFGEDRFYSSLFSVVGSNSIGNGGTIRVDTKSLSLSNGAKFSADTRGQGRAGNIEIKAHDSVYLDGADNTNSRSGFFTRSDDSATGRGGNIAVDTNFVKISNGAIINAQTFTPFRGGDIFINADVVNLSQSGSIVSTAINQGSAGNIEINAAQLKLNDRATISTSTQRSDGGEITLNIPDLLLLRRGSTISTTAGNDQSGGNGGNININGGFIIAIPKENSDITANAFNGNGGQINITSPGIFGLQFRPQLTPLSDITASSNFGLTGTVNLTTPDNSGIQNGLKPLATNAINTNALLANSCIIRTNKQSQSSFYITGTGTIPPRPNDAPISPYPIGELQPTTAPSPAKPWKLGDPIVEPQGVYQRPTGQLIMSRECDH